MNTLEINNVLKYYKNFKGVYPLDKIPNINKGSIIINTDVSSGPGKHWVAITINSRNSEYFDSFGLPPIHVHIIKFLNKFDGYCYNNITLQNINSTTCGNYCVVYVSLRCRGYKYNQILEIFNKNTLVNDKIVTEILKLMPNNQPIVVKTFNSVNNKDLI
jgi:hypothetical protein